MTRRHPAVTRRERGFALLIVLWTLGLLALIGTQVTSAGHTEAKLAGNLRGSAIAEAAADAAIDEAALHLIDPSGRRWIADGRSYLVRLPQATVLVQAATEQRKVPLNTVPTVLMAALLRHLGVDPRMAVVLAAQIGDWRSPANFPLRLGAKAPQYRAAGREWGPPNRPFRSVSELRLLLGMTPELYALLAPHVSAYTQSSPSVQATDPIVAAAIMEVAAGGLQPLSFDEAPIYDLTAVATSADGARFVRSAVIRINLPDEAAPTLRPYDVLGWFSNNEATDG